MGDKTGAGSCEGAGVHGHDTCMVGLNDMGCAFEGERNPLGYNPRQAVVGSGWTRASEVGTTWVRSSWQPSSR